MSKIDTQNKVWMLAPDIGEAEQIFVKEAFDSNWIAPLGYNVDKFEEELSNHFHNYDVHIVSSGTAAIHLALKALNIKPNDVVLCQSFTFAGSAFPILYEKAIPAFIDSEQDTWNLDPNYLEDAIRYYLQKNMKPAAIIAVHLYGMPAKMDELTALSLRYDIPIIEDAAEAMGSIYKNNNCGTLGDIGIVSFNGNKIITTSGGGAIISTNNQYINKARFYSNSSRDNLHYYSHSDIGYNYRMSNVLAGIGRGQLLNLNKKVEAKHFIYNTYKEILGKIDGINFLEEPENCFCNRWLTNVIISKKLQHLIDIDEIKKRFDKLNIETRFLWNPMHLQPVFKEAKFFGSNVCEDLFKSGICLPSSTKMTMEDVARVANLLKEMLYA
jgi:dTDP-4-amino-4,6-dideoxygalactose transaminase